jgi:hypothetical protein
MRKAGDVILAIGSGTLDPDRIIPLRGTSTQRSPAPMAWETPS